jgi:hypothetical protein
VYPKPPDGGSLSCTSGKKAYDFSDEVVHWEGSPAAADLGINVLLGFTLVALPLTIAAIGRTAFIKYRFTDKRVSVQTNAPWKSKGGGVSGQGEETVLVGRNSRGRKF